MVSIKMQKSDAHDIKYAGSWNSSDLLIDETILH